MKSFHLILTASLCARLISAQTELLFYSDTKCQVEVASITAYDNGTCDLIEGETIAAFRVENLYYGCAGKEKPDPSSTLDELETNTADDSDRVRKQWWTMQLRYDLYRVRRLQCHHVRQLILS